MEESTREEGMRRFRAEVMQGCASATNFRPTAVKIISNNGEATGKSKGI